MELLVVLLAFVGLMALIPLSIMFNAFVLHKMWAWFVVPLGVAPIGLAHAWGLAILIGMFTISLKRGTKDKKEQLAQAAILLSGPIFTLLFGWIAHSLM